MSVTQLKFILIDDDRRRAEAIATALKGHRGVTVADNLAELEEGPKVRCFVLVADEPGAIVRTVGHLKNRGFRAKVFAYARDPSPHGIVKALSAGAADYLHWPCDAANIIAAANAATAGAVD